MFEKEKQKRKQKPNHRHNVILITLSLVFISCGVSFWGITQSFRPEIESGDAAREIANRVLPHDLPETAQNLRLIYYSWQGYTAKMRFELSPDEVNFWLSSGGVCDESSLSESAERFSVWDTDPEWWRLGNALIYTMFDCGVNPYYLMMVDHTNESKYIIYIETGAD